MGRRISRGVEPGGIGFVFFDDNTISTAEQNANLKITANGTGTIEILKDIEVTGNLTINVQGDLRLADSAGGEYVALQAAASTTTYTVTMPGAVATKSGYALVSSNTGVTSWAPADPFAGTYTTETGSFSAASFGCYFVDTTAAAITATLPASPAVGDTIRFFDVAKTFDTNNLIVARNGKLIQGDADDLTVSSESAAFDLIFSGDTYGWRIFSI